MSLGQNTEATQTMVRLIEARGGAEGANIVFHLLQRLDEDLDRARITDDQQRTRELARSRAMLSGFLVDWARQHADPGIRRYTYRYMVFDAATKHLAAQLDPDPAAREAQLREALSLYEALRSPENVRLYQATLEDAAQPPLAVDEDPAVTFGLALVQFDLGNYAEAQPLLGRLLAQRLLGAPTIPVHEHGELRFMDNDRYWEAQYKLMRSNIELARDENDPALQATRRHLAMLYVREGERIGGTRWREQFEQLRREILPDFQPEAVGAADGT
jgi:tetratricopeptide (TPR) repeat protein